MPYYYWYVFEFRHLVSRWCFWSYYQSLCLPKLDESIVSQSCAFSKMPHVLSSSDSSRARQTGGHWQHTSEALHLHWKQLKRQLKKMAPSKQRIITTSTSVTTLNLVIWMVYFSSKILYYFSLLLLHPTPVFIIDLLKVWSEIGHPTTSVRVFP